MSRRRRLVLLAAGLLFLLWLGAGFTVDVLLTRRAPRFAEPLPPEFANSEPLAIELRLETRDGLALGAWWLPARDPRRAAIVLHGNDGSRTSSLPAARLLREEATSVLVLTLRAHGDSDGDMNDLGWSARHDLVAALDELERRAPGLPVVVLGTSLGAAVALYAAEETEARIDGWILEAPYVDLERAVRARLSMFLPPVLDELAWWTMRLSAPIVLETEVSDLAPIEHARFLAGRPVLVISGELDRHAPLADTRAIAERMGRSAELVVVPGVGHVELARVNPDRFRRVLGAVFARVEGTAER